MSTNLLELINENISEGVIATLSGFLGESPKNITTALSNAIPSVLAGLVNKGSNTQTASSLFTTLQDGKFDGGILDSLATAFTNGGDTGALVSSGGALLNTVFGHNTEGVANLVANASGISKTASNSLLGLITPMIFGVVGKAVSGQGISNAAGLMSLLGGQAGFLKNFLPVGLSSLLGMTHLPGFEHTPSVAAQYDAEDDTGGFGKVLPWLLIPAILGLGWGLVNYFKLPKLTAPESSVQQAAAPSGGEATGGVTAAPEMAAPAAEVATPAVNPEMPVNTPAPEAAATPAPATPAAVTTAAPVAEVFEKTLSSGFAVKASASGVENKLLSFLEDTSKAIDKDAWFTMNGVVFDSGKSTIKPESDVQLKNIVEIMKAFPAVKIKIGGYTDNSGNAKANVALSGQRATAVKKALVAGGIAATRLDAEGYGSEHPVASNDTKEGRQQNRRIDVRVTAK